MNRQAAIIVFVASALACNPQAKADETNESSLPELKNSHPIPTTFTSRAAVTAR